MSIASNEAPALPEPNHGGWGAVKTGAGWHITGYVTERERRLAAEDELALTQGTLESRERNIESILAASAELRREVEALRGALNRYADEARALAKHMPGGAHTPAVLASLTVLSLDGGRKADSAIATRP